MPIIISIGKGLTKLLQKYNSAVFMLNSVQLGISENQLTATAPIVPARWAYTAARMNPMNRNSVIMQYIISSCNSKIAYVRKWQQFDY